MAYLFCIDIVLPKNCKFLSVEYSIVEKEAETVLLSTFIKLITVTPKARQLSTGNKKEFMDYGMLDGAQQYYKCLITQC